MLITGTGPPIKAAPRHAFARPEGLQRRKVDCYGDSNMHKLCFCAGASSGIGLALAELLARSKEYTVIATARKPEVIKGKAEGMSSLLMLLQLRRMRIQA